VAPTDQSPAGGRAPLLETRAIDYIPRSERHGKVWYQGPFWFTSSFVLLTLAVGFTGPLAGLGFGWTAVAAVLGSAVGTFFMAFHANQGPRLGIPQMIQSRAQFGTRGVIVPLLAALAVYIGFNAFNGPMAIQGFQAVVGPGPRWPWYLTIMAVQAIIAVVGYDLIHRVQRWLTYVLMAVFAALTVGSLVVLGGYKYLTMGTFTATAFFSQFAVAAGYQIGFAIYVSDYTRYLPADTRLAPIVLWTYAGANLSAVWLMPLGALFAIALKHGATITSVLTAGNLVAPGLGSIAMTISSIALVTVMSVNTYGATLVALTAVDCFRPMRSSTRTRVLATVAVSVPMLGIALLLPTSYEDAFGSFLTLMLYFLVPWSAINLVDYYWVRRGDYAVLEIFCPDGIYGRWAWRGLLAYAVGFAAMVPFFSLPFFTGPAAHALGGVDISFALGLTVSALFYYGLAWSFDRSTEQAARLASVAALEPSGGDAPVGRLQNASSRRGLSISMRSRSSA
jgi:nucleobase:cation symporter-1, NCS1 family